MKNLEDQGFISSLHTSSGRVPTKKGYRYFVDSLLVFKNPSEDEVNMISGKINSSSSLTNTIADTLSNLPIMLD